MNKKNNLNSQLGYYLAGLIEGDGNIWTSKSVFTSRNIKLNKNRIYNPRIMITFHKNEMPLFIHLKEIIGSGSIFTETKQERSNCTKYTVSKKNDLVNLIDLINGKFRTPKIEYLYRAIDRINTIHNLNIEKLPLDTSNNILLTPWLTGMVDADGNFIISLEGVYGLNNSLVKGRVKCMFSLSQRIIDKTSGLSSVPYMLDIANLFECNIKYNKDNCMNIVVQANSKHYLVKVYFDKYPLMTSKYLNYLSYVKGLEYLGRQLSDQEILDVQSLKNSMNNKRIVFNWDHLDNFYK